MTKRHQTFSAPPKVTAPVTFTIQSDDEGKTWSEDFTAVPSIPGAALLDFIADADSGDGGRAAQSLVDFMQGVIVDDDKDRFMELVRDPEKVIEIETLAAICEWLVGEYAKRPTQTSRPSPAGRSRSGRGSTAGASSRG